MYKLTACGVQRLGDGVFIPESDGNRDWLEYLQWLAVGNSPEPADEVAVDFKALIADRRWIRMCRGITVNGVDIDTDDASQIRINGAALSAMIDPEYTVDWKSADGTWVSLNAAQIIEMAKSIRNYVQACYDRERELEELVEAGTFELAMLDEGWPE